MEGTGLSSAWPDACHLYVRGHRNTPASPTSCFVPGSTRVPARAHRRQQHCGRRPAARAGRPTTVVGRRPGGHRPRRYRNGSASGRSAADEVAALRAEPGAPIAFRRTPSAENPDRIVIDDAHSRTIGQLAPRDAHTMAPLLDSGVLDGTATVRQLSMLRSGRVLLRISVELTPMTASARR